MTQPYLTNSAHWAIAMGEMSLVVDSNRRIPAHQISTIAAMTEHLPRYQSKTWCRNEGVHRAARMAQDRYHLDPAAVSRVLAGMGVAA